MHLLAILQYYEFFDTLLQNISCTFDNKENISQRKKAIPTKTGTAFYYAIVQTYFFASKYSFIFDTNSSASMP